MQNGNRSPAASNRPLAQIHLRIRAGEGVCAVLLNCCRGSVRSRVAWSRKQLKSTTMKSPQRLESELVKIIINIYRLLLHTPLADWLPMPTYHLHLHLIYSHTSLANCNSAAAIDVVQFNCTLYRSVHILSSLLRFDFILYCFATRQPTTLVESYFLLAHEGISYNRTVVKN